MNYKNLPDHSKVWVYQSNREFTQTELEKLQAKFTTFLGGWNSHGADITGVIEVFYNRFIVVFVDETATGASGCSIDKSVGLIKQIEQEFGVNMFDRLLLAYKDGEQIKTLKMPDFKAELQQGNLTADTTVFNNLVLTQTEFLNNWEVPVKNSWHKQMLG